MASRIRVTQGTLASRGSFLRLLSKYSGRSETQGEGESKRKRFHRHFPFRKRVKKIKQKAAPRFAKMTFCLYL